MVVRADSGISPCRSWCWCVVVSMVLHVMLVMLHAWRHRLNSYYLYPWCWCHYRAVIYWTDIVAAQYHSCIVVATY